MKQVESTHYDFARYMYKGRWVSVWHQLSELVELKPEKVLEVGPGSGLFAKVARHIGLNVETIDIDPALAPDHLGSATAMPLKDATYDVVCAFQVLEHLPYESALRAFAEMRRVSNGHVLISLPNAEPSWRYQFHLPKIGSYDLVVRRPFAKLPEHVFDGEHYWELGKRGYEVSRVARDFGRICRLVKQYRVTENPYHHFFLFEI